MMIYYIVEQAATICFPLLCVAKRRKRAEVAATCVCSAVDGKETACPLFLILCFHVPFDY